MNKIIAFLIGVGLAFAVHAQTSNPGGKVRITDGTETATVRNTGTEDSLNVSIVDATGNQITLFGSSGSITPSDNFANPTDAINSTSFGMVWDGATWDRHPGNTLGAVVQGPVAIDAVVAGNPVIIGGRGSNTTPTSVTTGDAQQIWLDREGAIVQVTRTSAGALSNDNVSATTSSAVSITNSGIIFPGRSYLFDGTDLDSQRSAGIGNNVASTGIIAAAPYGQYTGNATQPAITTGSYSAAQLDSAGNLRTAPQRPTATDIVMGYAAATADVASTALIIVSAGRTWVGDVCATVGITKAAAATGNGEAIVTFLTAGVGVVPAAGTYFGVNALAGANAATGTVGTQGNESACDGWTVVAPAGNTVTVNYAVDCNNHTTCRADISANGVMQ